MTQSRNAVSNLVARYKAVLKNCHLLNIMAAAVVAGAVVVGSAGMAVAADAETTTDNSTVSFTGEGELTVKGDPSTNPTVSTNVKDGTFTITGESKTITMGGTEFKLEEKTTITGGGTLGVNGLLTQVAAGSDISGVNVEIAKGTGESKLALSNGLTVGNVAFTDDTGIRLDTENGAHTLTTTAGKALTFGANTDVMGESGASLLINGAGSVAVNGALSIHRDTTLDVDTTISSSGTLLVTTASSETNAIKLNAKNITNAGTFELATAATATVGTITNGIAGTPEVGTSSDPNYQAKVESQAGTIKVTGGTLTVDTITNGIAAVMDDTTEVLAAAKGTIEVTGGKLMANSIDNIGAITLTTSGTEAFLIVNEVKGGTVDIKADATFVDKNGIAISANEASSSATFTANGTEFTAASGAGFHVGGTGISFAEGTQTNVLDADGLEVATTKMTFAKPAPTAGASGPAPLDVKFTKATVTLFGDGAKGEFLANADSATVDGATLNLGLANRPATGGTGTDYAENYLELFGNSGSYTQGGNFAGKLTLTDGTLNVNAGEWKLGSLEVASGKTATVFEGATLGIDMTGAKNKVDADPTNGIEAVEETYGIKGTVTFEEGSTLLVSGAVIDKEADLTASGTLDNIIGTLTDNVTNLEKATIKTDNQLLKIAYDEDKTQIVATAVSATEALPGIDPSLAGALSSYDEGDNAFLKKSLAMDKETASKSIESAAKVGAAAGVGGAIGNVGAAGAANIQVRTGSSSATAFNEFDTSNMLAMSGDGAILPVAHTQEGFGIWFMPMYKHTSADGFKSGNSSFGYDTDLYGATLGADYTFASSLRLGLAFNVGTGETDSTGDFADTNSDFDYVGLSAYGSMSFGHLALSADIGYTSSDNDVHQKNAGASLSADIDAALISAGVKAEYQIALNSLNITPYAGIRVNYYDIDSFDVGNVQHTDSSDYTVVEFPIGLTFDTTLNAGDWDITPSLGLGVKFAAGDLDPEQEVRFNGLDESSVLSSEVADEVTFQGALGLGFAKDAYSIDLGYTLDLSENVESHGVNVNLRYEF